MGCTFTDWPTGLRGKLGHDVTVLHNPDAYEVLTGKKVAASYEDHPNITIKKITTPLKRLSLLAVHQTGRPFGQKASLQECFKEPFDVIHYYNITLLGGPDIFSYWTEHYQNVWIE